VITKSSGTIASPSQELAQALGCHLYEMAKLSVGGLEPEQLNGFQQRSTDLIGQLLQRGLV
jgi:molecular chaperone HtpG